MRSAIPYNDYVSRVYSTTSLNEDVRKDRENNPDKAGAKSITFCVTTDCQLRCTYCYEKHKGDKYMQFETAKKYIDLILSGDKNMDKYLSVDDAYGCTLDFIGGEPLLAIDLIEQIVEYWMDRTMELNHPWGKNFKIAIGTNGVDYFNPKVQAFIEKYRNVLSMSVTVDGDKELHDKCRIFNITGKGSYDLAAAAAQDLILEKGFPRDGSKITLSPENIPYMIPAVKNIIDLGYDGININCAYEPEYTKEDASIFYNQLKGLADYFIENDFDFHDFYFALFKEDVCSLKNTDDLNNWCGGDGKMIACDYTGKIYPCVRFMETSLGDEQPEFVIGDVDNGMLCTEQQKCNNCVLGEIDRRAQSTDECFYCPLANGCSWCTAWNYQLYGTPNKRCTNICIMHKARALANVYFWNKYYLKNNIDDVFMMNVPKEWALDIISEEEYFMLLSLVQSLLRKE